MAIDVNYHPEHFSNTSGNIVYQWWCLKCQANHYTPWCPYDVWDNMARDFKECINFETCPHCGQLIKREV